MTADIHTGGLRDSLSYLVFGDGEAETFEPFCEASLIQPYPHGSLHDARALLGSAGRIQLVANQARHSTWIVDQAVRVKGWSEEVVRANAVIWSKRLTVANITWALALVSAIGTSIYTFACSAAVQHVLHGQATQAAGATLGVSAAVLLGAVIVGSIALCYLASARSRAAKVKLEATQKTAAEEVAHFRDLALTRDFYGAIAHRGTPGQITRDGFITPQETEWLWVERIQKESASFDNPTMATGAELTLAFTRKNPFDVMDKALEGASLLAVLSSAKATYQPLAAELRQIQQLYDMRARDIRQLAEKNRQLIRERRRAAFNVVDSIYWNKVHAARSERDRALRPHQISTVGLSLAEAKEAERRYNSNPTVIRIKADYHEQVRSYAHYRDLAHTAIYSWFNPQIQKEYEKETTDLKASYETNLRHLSGYYPTVRSLYSWTSRVVSAYSPVAPFSYVDVVGATPTLPRVIAPVLPDMQTAVQPEEPSSSEMSAWASAGSGLGLGFFLTCAAAGAGFYAAYQANRGSYESVIAANRDDEEVPPPRYQEPQAPPPYTPAFYQPPVAPSAPFYDWPLPADPPSYAEATGGYPEPSAPPEDLVLGSRV